MPHSSDDPSSDRISAEAPSAQPTEGVESEPASPSQPNPSAENVSIESDPQGRMAESGEAPKLPRRRRRRRRPPRAADPAEATAARQGPAEQPATAGDAPQSGDFSSMQPPAGEPRRRRRRRGQREGQPHEQPRSRRRRRRPPRPAEASAAEADGIVPSAAATGTPAGAARYRSTPYRDTQARWARNGRGGDDRSPERRPVGDNRRSPDRRARGKGTPSRDDRRQRRDRDAARTKPERRLYALEAIVDRGFEDVVDAAEDNLTRRVHWTIIKRTVADQESGKPISATYVLKRDGVDTEFPGLGAARSAANKTIVHPEKLTLSKADHAAAKK